MNTRTNLNVNGLNGERPRSLGAKTVVKYEKSSCLFCNEWFDSQTFTEHLIHCGQVLQECPNQCNAYIPRIRLRSHLRDCPNSMQNMNDSSERLDIEKRVQSLEQDNRVFRSVLNEEIRERLHLITDVGNLRRQNQIADDSTALTKEQLLNVRQQLEEENQQRSFEVEQCQNDFRYCYDQMQSIKSEMSNQINELQQNLDQLSMEVNRQEERLNAQEDTKFNEVVLRGADENDANNSLPNLNATEITNKWAILDCEVKGMKNIVCETEDRCEKLTNIVTNLERNFGTTMKCITDLEHQLAMQRQILMQNTKGHLIWRIKEFGKKFNEAKQYETILHSSLFSNKPYGYALRLDVYLNGKGSWKGRSLLACVNVVVGEYDFILPWPCRLQADIILRDLNPIPSSEVKDYTKTVCVRRKNDEIIQQNQYFHIPHELLATEHFIRYDSVIFEIRILKN